MANLLGLSTRKRLSMLQDRTKKMKNESLPFKPSKQNEWSDCYRDKAMKCVHEFCHSEEGSLVDTEPYWVFVVYDLVTTKNEKHPMRVWHDVGLTGQYQSFCESDAYAKSGSNNDQLTICKEVPLFVNVLEILLHNPALIFFVADFMNTWKPSKMQ
jgi:hypothetical protein